MFVSTPGLHLASCCRSNRLVDVLSRWQMSSDPVGTLGLLTHRGEHQPVSGSSSKLLSCEIRGFKSQHLTKEILSIEIQ